MKETLFLIKLYELGFPVSDFNSINDIEIPTDWLNNNLSFIRDNYSIDDIDELLQYCENEDDALLLCAKNNIFNRVDLVIMALGEYNIDSDTIIYNLFDSSFDFLDNNIILDNLDLFEVLSNHNDDVNKRLLLLNPDSWLSNMIDNEINFEAEHFDNEDLSDVIDKCFSDIDILTSYEFTSGLKDHIKNNQFGVDESELLSYIKDNFTGSDLDKFTYWINDWFDQDTIDYVMKLSNDDIEKRDLENRINSISSAPKHDRISIDDCKFILSILGVDSISFTSGYVGLEDMSFDAMYVDGNLIGDTFIDGKPWINNRRFGDNLLSFTSFSDTLLTISDFDLFELDLSTLVEYSNSSKDIIESKIRETSDSSVIKSLITISTLDNIDPPIVVDPSIDVDPHSYNDRSF